MKASKLASPTCLIALLNNKFHHNKYMVYGCCPQFYSFIYRPYLDVLVFKAPRNFFLACFFTGPDHIHFS